MKLGNLPSILLFLLVFDSSLIAAETSKYSAPRFPSYVKPPKSIDDIMPFANLPRQPISPTITAGTFTT